VFFPFYEKKQNETKRVSLETIDKSVHNIDYMLADIFFPSPIASRLRPGQFSDTGPLKKCRKCKLVYLFLTRNMFRKAFKFFVSEFPQVSALLLGWKTLIDFLACDAHKCF
jgi:hypothetical protein